MRAESLVWCQPPPLWPGDNTRRAEPPGSEPSLAVFLPNPTLPVSRLADEGPSWSCDFVGAYHGLVPECCCFSADGSLLAVGFQEVVTVWSAASWELLTTLSQPPKAIRSESQAHTHTHSLSLLSQSRMGRIDKQ